MKEKFKEYGEIVSIDLTFNMIKDTKDEGKKYKLGFFLGSSRTKRIVPLGFVVTLNTYT